MSDRLAEHLGIDPADPSARLAREVVEADDHLLRSLAARRVALGMTLEQLAELTGFTPEVVLAVEHGTLDPSLSMLRRIAHALGLRIDHHVTGPNGQAAPEEILMAIAALERPYWSAEPSMLHPDEWNIMTRSTEDLHDLLLEASGLTYTGSGTVDEAEARFIAAVSPHRIAPLLRELLQRRARDTA